MAKKVRRKKTGAGWSRMGQYKHEDFALRKAESRKHAFNEIAVVRGVMGQAFKKPTEVFRVWIK